MATERHETVPGESCRQASRARDLNEALESGRAVVGFPLLAFTDTIGTALFWALLGALASAGAVLSCRLMLRKGPSLAPSEAIQETRGPLSDAPVAGTYLTGRSRSDKTAHVRDGCDGGFGEAMFIRTFRRRSHGRITQPTGGRVTKGATADRHRRWFLGCGVIMLSILSASCTGSEPQTLRPSGTIIVGSFNFPESVVLANLYAEALRSRGYPVSVLPNIGTREVVDPALGRGLLDLVPEYAGSALEFFSLGTTPAAHEPSAAHAALVEALSSHGLVALAAARAQDANAIVVTAATAKRYHLRTISDLAPVAPALTLGGPPECPSRPFCLRGLRSVYGLSFHSFVGLDVDGPLTLQALIDGDVGVAVMTTTLPTARADHLVILSDDRGLQPAENVTPVLREVVLKRYGEASADAVNAVSERLTTVDLTLLDAAVLRDPSSASAVADHWLTAQGLM
jgi:osmoprotectant transport system substrate-binding protein